MEATIAAAEVAAGRSQSPTLAGGDPPPASAFTPVSVRHALLRAQAVGLVEAAASSTTAAAATAADEREIFKRSLEDPQSEGSAQRQRLVL